jgi:hypothetical protein
MRAAAVFACSIATAMATMLPTPPNWTPTYNMVRRHCCWCRLRGVWAKLWSRAVCDQALSTIAMPCNETGLTRLDTPETNFGVIDFDW